MLYLWYTFTAQCSDPKSFYKRWIAFHVFWTFFPLLFILELDWMKRSSLASKQAESGWYKLFYWRWCFHYNTLTESKTLICGLLVQTCQTQGNVRSNCVTVFTEKWQSGHDSFSWGKNWTRCGPSHRWKPSRLIRRHLRLQKADSSSLRHKQWGHHDRAFISGSSGVGRQRDSSW